MTGPARPLDKSTTVSLVEQHPSTVISLKLSETELRRIRESVPLSQLASVVRTASIVAMSGESIAAPFAIPPTLKPAPSTSTSFRAVSVVIIATAACRPASPPPSKEAIKPGTPASNLAIGNGMPIRPVWQTRTSSAEVPIPSATISHMRSAARRPAVPVCALALPLEQTTADASPPVESRCARLTRTGAALALLLVNTAAAGTGRRSCVHTRAMSEAPDSFMPHATPAATKPMGPVTPTASLVRTPVNSHGAHLRAHG